MSGDGPVTIVGGNKQDNLFDGKTNEEIESMFDAIRNGEITPEPEPDREVPQPEPEPAPEPAPEAPETAAPEVPAEPAAAPPTPEELSSMLEGERLRREKLEAQYQQQMAHGSRLAGEIGHLRKLLETRPASEPYQPQMEDDSRLSTIERTVNETRDRQVRSEVAQAVNETLARLDAASVDDLKAELTEIAPRYREQMQEIYQFNDPSVARQGAEAIGRMVLAEARELKWEKNHKALLERKATTAPKVDQQKKATAPSGSGGVPPPPPKPKTLRDMTAAEADAWLRENVS